MDGINLKITGTLTDTIDNLRDALPRAEKRALYRAAYFLRDKIRQSLVSAIPKATVRNPNYNDTLADAVRFTRVDGASLKVHALGTRASGSGTFRTRFFEAGTVERFHKQRNGIKLNKKKSVGHITATHFFQSAVDANRSAVTQIMEDVISEYVNIAIKNTN